MRSLLRRVLLTVALAGGLVRGAVVGATPASCESPRPDCRPSLRPRTSNLLVTDRTPDTGDRVTWKWRHGAETALTDFEDPTNSTTFVVCVFDPGGSSIMRMTVPSAATCGSASCWQRRGARGFAYESDSGSPDGVTALGLGAGAAGTARITLKGEGAALQMPSIPSLALPLRVQLNASAEGACWESVYTTSGLQVRSATQLRVRGGLASLPGPAGQVHFFRVADTAFDRFTDNPTPSAQQWMRDHYWRMLTYSPYFNSRTGWFPNGWVYKDLYAIYVGSSVAAAHPEWILRDGGGAPLYIPYKCSGGTCPQYAADPGNAAFRSDWIAAARATLAAGYRGLYVDDVNLSISRVSDGTSAAVAPIDPRTNAPMAEADWRRYVAEFTEAIRSAFPQTEIAHNHLWFLGHDDPFIQRELLSADWISFERGFNDNGIHGGGGTYGFDTFLGHIDWLHAQGRHVVLEGEAVTTPDSTYGLAGYFLISTGSDGVGNDVGGTPGDWWSGYDASLGDPAGDRYLWQGVLRRDFAQGIVLLNPPGAPSTTIDLGASYLDLAGRSRTSVTLDAASGAVFRQLKAPALNKARVPPL